MENATMLYQSPGPHTTDGISYDYTVVDATEVEAMLAEGWHLNWVDADQARKDAAAAQLKANEEEQARIAAKLEEAKKVEAGQLTAVHKGNGKWSVVDAAGTEIETGLSKEDAKAKVDAQAGG